MALSIHNQLFLRIDEAILYQRRYHERGSLVVGLSPRTWAGQSPEALAVLRMRGCAKNFRIVQSDIGLCVDSERLVEIFKKLDGQAPRTSRMHLNPTL
jgi:hypothetical protein